MLLIMLRNSCQFVQNFSKTQEKLLKPFPEAKTLSRMQEKATTAGIVTSKRRKATRESLSITGLDKYLEVVWL